MPIETVTSTPAAATTAPAVQETTSNATLDKDAFLTLLVAQLKYQDPTAPTDVSQMMAQTSQLSMVERLDQIAAGIEVLGGGAPLSSAASMLGREVTFDIGGPTPVTAIVDAVRVIDGVTLLSAGGYDVPLGALLQVSDVATAAPAVDASDATDAADDAGSDEAESDDGVEAADGLSGDGGGDTDEVAGEPDVVPGDTGGDELDDGLGLDAAAEQAHAD